MSWINWIFGLEIIGVVFGLFKWNIIFCVIIFVFDEYGKSFVSDCINIIIYDGGKVDNCYIRL